MRIKSEKLKAIAAARGVSAEQLAQALPQGERRKQAGLATNKVHNWMAGRDHPRCKPVDIAAMAQVLGVSPKDIAKFTSICRFARTSDQKAGLITAMIRGRTVDEAEALLEFNPRRATMFVKKALKAATEDAMAAEADSRRLVITESRVDGGPVTKRFHPKDRGRAHQILKKTSHIVIGVEEVG